jgi:hypothetical protein
MHISSKSVISDSIKISSENIGFYSAIRTLEKLAYDILKESSDENLLASCQVIGYEVIKTVYQSKSKINLSVKMQVNPNGIEMRFYADDDAYELLKREINENGYFKNKLAYICDNHVIDERDKSLTCLFDGNSFNRQLSSERILTLKKYLKKENIESSKFYD